MDQSCACGCESRGHDYHGCRSCACCRTESEALDAARAADLRRRFIDGGPRAFAAPSKDGRTGLVHRDSYSSRLGEWRLTRFDSRMDQIGQHVESPSWERAVDAALEFGCNLALAYVPK